MRTARDAHRYVRQRLGLKLPTCFHPLRSCVAPRWDVQVVSRLLEDLVEDLRSHPGPRAERVGGLITALAECATSQWVRGAADADALPVEEIGRTCSDVCKDIWFIYLAGPGVPPLPVPAAPRGRNTGGWHTHPCTGDGAGPVRPRGMSRAASRADVSQGPVRGNQTAGESAGKGGSNEACHPAVHSYLD